MPARLSGPDRALLFGGGAVFLAIVLAALLLVRSADGGEDNASSYSTGSGGAKAAYLLLQTLGYRVSRSEQPPAELTDPASTILILAEPSEPPDDQDRAAIQHFLERGGRVIATGLVGSRFLSAAAAPDPIRGLDWKRAQAASPSPITTAAPAITIRPSASWPAAAPAALALYTCEDAAVVAVFARGAGDAYWWASATPLTNAGVTQPGNLEFLLASLGPANARRVIFDEYFHGARQSLAVTVLRSPVKWLLVQLAVGALIVLWTYARRRGPIMAPPAESRLVPLEFVRTLGSLYERAGAASIAVAVAERRFRYRLTRRLAMSSTAPTDSLERAVRQRWPAGADGLADTLRSCEAAASDERLTSRQALRLVRSLAARAASLNLFSTKESL